MEIGTCLAFDGDAEQALNFYTTLLPDTKVLHTMRAPPGVFPQDGGFVAATFEMLGRRFMVLNGPKADFTHAVSLIVTCDTQDEIDRLWDKLSDGGTPVACGWITDKFGLSWQIAPRMMIDLLASDDPQRASRAMKAMMQMVKLDIAQLQRAADGE